MTLSKILLTLAVLLPLVISAQTKTEKFYLDSTLQVCDSLSAKFVSYHIYNDSLAPNGIIRITDLDGEILHEDEYSNIPDKVSGGYTKWLTYNVTPRFITTFQDGNRHGELCTFYVSGQLKRKDIYENGVLVAGNCYTASGLDTTYTNYEIPPIFKGGEVERVRFLIKNIKYPKAAYRKGIAGVVVVKFVVGKDGTLSNIGIQESVHPLLDEEALRVIRLMPPWIPGTQDGENVRVQFNMPIKFSVYNNIDEFLGTSN